MIFSYGKDEPESAARAAREGARYAGKQYQKRAAAGEGGGPVAGF